VTQGRKANLKGGRDEKTKKEGVTEGKRTEDLKEGRKGGV
jgi:hypothetical protein